MTDTDLGLFRHILATLAYRGAKTMRGAPPEFADFRPGPTSNTPVEIVAHLGDLMDASLRLLAGHPEWRRSTPQDWNAECTRFFESLKRLDDYLASGLTIHGDLFRLLQGPVVDALTHVGQLAMLRRLSGSPMKGESYYRADIRIGRIGAEQTPADPQAEFD